MDGVDGSAAPRSRCASAEPHALPADDASANLVVSNLAVAAAADPGAAAEEIGARAGPGRNGHHHGAAARNAGPSSSTSSAMCCARAASSIVWPRSIATSPAFPTATRVAGWLQRAGLVDVGVDVERWEILFKTSREFLFAPLVELGPLSQWKRLAGGGDDMQDAFFFTKEAIDTYFKGRPFAITVVGAVAWGQKRR